MPHGFEVPNAHRVDLTPLFLSKAAAARRVGVSLHRLRQLISAGEIDVYFNGWRELVITASVDRFRDRITSERRAAP